MTTTIDLLSKIMDCAALRQSVLANNMANANTPKYKRMDVEFQGALNDALNSSQLDSINDFKPAIVEDPQAEARGDGNTVSLQREIGAMTENALLYNFAAKAVSKKLATISKAISGR